MTYASSGARQSSAPEVPATVCSPVNFAVRGDFDKLREVGFSRILAMRHLAIDVHDSRVS